MSDELARLREENERLRRQLDAAREQSDRWREVAEERRVAMERLRQHPVVRVLYRLARLVLPGLRVARHRAAPVVRTARRTGSALKVLPDNLGAAQRERALMDALERIPPPPPDPRRVALVILTRDGRDNLARLLPAIRGTTEPSRTEIVVVDNASGEGTTSFLASQDDVRVVRNETNLSFSAANNAGAAATDAPVLCFLNDDVEPIAPGWLDHLLGELDGDVAAVGAQLVYPRRGLFEGRTADVSVQHIGIELHVDDDVPVARNVSAPTPDPSLPAGDVHAATAACLLVDRAAFDRVGGFDDRYEYGAEDVDLCVRLREAGHRLRVAPAAVLWHHEGATRHRVATSTELNERQARNWRRFAERFGPSLSRSLRLATINGGDPSQPLRLAVTVTRDDPDAGYGDWYTAHELGAACERIGWTVTYVERYRDAWYDQLDDVDAVLVLLDLFDVRRAPEGVTTIAWIRNWPQRWMAHPWFEAYDVVLTSSERMADEVEAEVGVRPEVLRLATSPERFAREPGGDRAGVVLTANHWGRDRGLDAVIAAVPELELYGKGWEGVPEASAVARGPLPYEALADLYARSEVVLDVGAEHTADSGALNSRVFDGLAAGALVVTDQVAGAEELFDAELPAYSSASELPELLAGLRSDPQTPSRLERLRDRVLAEHTYEARARQLRDILVAEAERARVALLIGTPDRRSYDSWGDSHLAEALARALARRGVRTRIFTADGWGARARFGQDVCIHLKGRGVAERAEGQFHVLWVISHPDEVTPGELDGADLVLAASEGLAHRLREQTETPVEVLLQATDARRFRPRPPDPRYTHDVAFVGNSKFTFRPVIEHALQADLDVAIYGANWEKFIDPRHVRAKHVPNDELPSVYSSVGVLLNDHWDDMRRAGIVSNRLFDALACGAVVVSDDVPGLAELFDGAVETYSSPDDLRRSVERLLSDADERARRSSLGREIVSSAHTFDHRAEQLLGHLERYRD